MPYEVFISHSSTDRKIAEAVCARLEQAQIGCWIAPRDIEPGTSWPAAIIEALSQCKVFVLVFSPPSNASQQVFREVERAVHKGLIVIPFRIEACEPSGAMEYFIGAAHWLDAITPPLQQHIEKLLDSVSRLLRGYQPPPGADAAQVAADASFINEFRDISLDDWSRKPSRGLRGILGRFFEES